ncbi:flagellar hook protein FlgE [Ferrovibrio sp.]|uniref:flagellar hook protein FlgE n=1 Tax=Ferrovibrio sp. TaxID=1917215 RepID=UPI0025C63C9D|nr:flagellar hook protein FlgE [Ferrovibrio sp.]MBX3453534.1 flagellar hook protein FlgE [Ferrovibrio sp.]
MSISAALQSAISGLNGQATAIGYISDNVANASTPGYKKVESRFSTLVTQSSAQANTHSPGGVQNRPFFANNAQGAIAQVSSTTSVAVSGDGFIPVSRAIGIDPTTGNTIFEDTSYYTRLGDFTQNSAGYLVNSSGYYLQGWTVDPTTGVVDTSATSEVRVSDLLDAPVATSNIEYSAILPANALDTSGNLPATLAANSIQVYDALGNARTLDLTWTRNAANEWEVTISTVDDTGATQTFGPASLTFGSLGNAGTIGAITGGGGLTAPGSQAAGDDAALSFNVDFFGDGSSQAINLDLGSFNSTNGTTQFGGTTLSLNDIAQNGVPRGNFKSLAIDENGFVSVTFDNGNVKKFFQIPLAKFRDPTELDRVDGNAFAATPGSGTAVLNTAGSSGLGSLVSAAIEQSNVDIAEEFSKMIVAQRAYSANARMITVADELLQETINIRR